MSTEIYFIRHGESKANAEGIIAGWRDSPLTEKGIRQAQSEAAMIRRSNIRFDVIMSSPLSRAYDTAKMIAVANDFPVDDIIVLDDLKEKSLGAFEGGSPKVVFDASDEDIKHAGAESYDDFALRIRRANGKIMKLAAGNTLVVGHSGFYRMAQCVEQNLPPSSMATIEKPVNGKLMRYPLEGL